MKLLLVCPYDPDRHGGVQRHIHALAAALTARGHETLILAPGRSEFPQPGLRRAGGMRSIRLGGTRFEVSWVSHAERLSLLEDLRSWRPDVAHFHTIWDPLMPWQVFRRLSIPGIATFHDTPPQGVTGFVLRNLFKVLSRYLLSQLDGAIAVSSSPMAHLRPGPSGVQPIVLPPVTDLSPFFAIEKRAVSRPRILFVGRLEPRKGVYVLLEAIRLLATGTVPLAAGVPSPHFVLAGDGDLRGDVLATQAQLGHGWIDYVPAPSPQQQVSLLTESTLAVSPALYGESFGIVLAEALAGGTPILGADNAGYRTVLTGEGASLLVPAGNAVALAQRIAELLSRPREVEALSHWGRNHARQFDVGARIGDFELAYREAILHHARSKRDG
ncbi:glycosyltransferase family 4 protein [Aestuariivirga sp.]|uniref:glycosyltransferase family 4 protein n=1 Tax=Aestuariivirga sp. TaxID=2650926 RepID=UPI003BA84550